MVCPPTTVNRPHILYLITKQMISLFSHMDAGVLKYGLWSRRFRSRPSNPRTPSGSSPAASEETHFPPPVLREDLFVMYFSPLLSATTSLSPSFFSFSSPFPSLPSSLHPHLLALSALSPLLPSSLLLPSLPLCLLPSLPSASSLLSPSASYLSPSTSSFLSPSPSASSLLSPSCSPHLPRTTLVASQTQVYKLEPKAYDAQVYQYVQGKQFELALHIAVSWCQYLVLHNFSPNNIIISNYGGDWTRSAHLPVWQSRVFLLFLSGTH